MFFFLGQGLFVLAQTKTYKIAVEKSTIHFKVKHLGVLNVKGSFNGFEGNLVFEKDKLQEVESVVKAESIETKDQSRDENLRDTAYLNVRDYPHISFSSTSIEDSGDTRTIKGILTIKEVEKEISFPYTHEQHTDGHSMILAEVVIKRKDFGLDFGSMDSLVGNVVKVELQIAYTPIK